MSLRLFSQVNGDSDLIEAWLNYYLRLGVDWFHLIVHGPPVENERLLAIKDSYPLTIEETYEGPFPAPISADTPTNTEKKKRLDALLARHTGQWILLVDSDEFVEFPYENIPATIRKLESANANVMAAPMLQRLTADGSLETPPRIDDPFEVFPLCSVDVYRRMGVKAEIFKFPLFYCVSGTELVEEGNHYPPLGPEPREAGMVGVTHHFKFRRSVWGRLEKRINSPHAWRHESVGCREYLESHDNRLPLEAAFPYSREELFRRRLLRPLPLSKPACQKSPSRAPVECQKNASAVLGGEIKGAAWENANRLVSSSPVGQRMMFVLPKATEFGGLERYLLDLLRRLPDPLFPPFVLCLGHDVITPHLDEEQQARIIVKCVNEPQSFWDWLRIIRQNNPDIIVFCSTSVVAFPWQAPVASLLAGVRKRISIQHLVPPPLPPPVQGKSPRDMLRRWIGRRARQVLKVMVSARISSYVYSNTVCVCGAVRDALVKTYGFRAQKTVTIFKGVSTSTFSPSKTKGAGVRARLDIDPEEFLLVCAARLVETKGLDILIHAVSRVVRQGVSCRCLIVGDGPLKEKLMRLANSLGLSHYVLFEGFHQDVRPYLQASSAFILTSRMEGLPVSVLEAMACGLPCIVTNVGGSPEAVKDHITGLVIPPSSVEAAADAILYLATHPDKRAQMASKSREMVIQNFDIEDRINDLKPILCR
jgi:glycosyltransferase involved in cell wall biosynthesis